MKRIENKTIIEDLDHLKEIEIVVRVDKKNTEEVVKILGILSANKTGEANKGAGGILCPGGFWWKGLVAALATRGPHTCGRPCGYGMNRTL